MLTVCRPKHPSLFCLISLTLSATAFADTELTIYRDFAVMKDSVPLSLKAGSNEVRYQNITRSLEPSSVMLLPQKSDQQFVIREQSYQSAPLSESRLLQQFEGQSIDFLVRFNDHETIKTGKIVRAPGLSLNEALSPMIELDGKLQFHLPGRPLFPANTGNSLLKPELNWVIQSAKSGTIDADLSYLTGGFGWDAAYNFIQKTNSTQKNNGTQKNDTMEASGWLTVRNHSGTGFDNLNIRLVAGDVNRVQPQRQAKMMMLERAMVADAAAPEVTEQAIDEFHMYTVPGQLALRDGETKQIEFIKGHGIRYQTELVYDGAILPPHYNAEYVRTQRNFGAQGNTQVNIFKVFDNKLDNGLGKPLPAGKVRFYQQEGSGLVFIGENLINHTPKDETIRLFTGTAFDVIGERKQTDFVVFGSQNRARETIEISLKNRKDAPATIKVVEHLYRGAQYTLTSAHQWQKEDAQTMHTSVTLPAGAEQLLRYTVEYRW